MKTIYLKVEVPDTIPDPDIMVSARVKDTFDEWEELNFEEINMQTEGKRQWKTLSEYTPDIGRYMVLMRDGSIDISFCKNQKWEIEITHPSYVIAFRELPEPYRKEPQP